MSVPRHRIPKIKVECPLCLSTSTSTVLSQPQAAGYHRRHICNDCDCGFYTLAEYEGSRYTVQMRPFKDRALTEAEHRQRVEWASETTPITLEGNNQFATEFIETINDIFDRVTKGVEPVGIEKTIIDTINELERQYDGN